MRHAANGASEAGRERRGNVGNGGELGRLPTLGIYDDANVGRTRDTTARPTFTRAPASRHCTPGPPYMRRSMAPAAR